MDRCRNAHDLLEKIVNRRGIGISLLSEPFKTRTEEIHPGCGYKEEDTAIWWTGKREISMLEVSVRRKVFVVNSLYLNSGGLRLPPTVHE